MIFPDLGAQHWVDTIRTIKEVNPATTVEVLIPDFQGRLELVDQVVEAAPEIISHNMENRAAYQPAGSQCSQIRCQPGCPVPHSWTRCDSKDRYYGWFGRNPRRSMLSDGRCARCRCFRINNWSIFTTIQKKIFKLLST